MNITNPSILPFPVTKGKLFVQILKRKTKDVFPSRRHKGICRPRQYHTEWGCRPRQYHSQNISTVCSWYIYTYKFCKVRVCVLLYIMVFGEFCKIYKHNTKTMQEIGKRLPSTWHWSTWHLQCCQTTESSLPHNYNS